MKHNILTAVLVMTAAASCTTHPDKKVAEIFSYWNEDTTLVSSATQLSSRFSDRGQDDSGNSDAVDYFTLLADTEMKAKEIFTSEAVPDGNLNLEADIIRKGRKSTGKTILISAPIDTWVDTLGVRHDNIDACLAALKVASSIKKLNMKGHNNIRLLLYQSCGSSLEGLRRAYRSYERNNDEIILNIELRSEDGQERTFHIGETDAIYRQFEEIIPPFFKPYGEYTFIHTPAVEKEWPVKASHYRYTVHRESLGNDIASVTALLYLLN